MIAVEPPVRYLSEHLAPKGPSTHATAVIKVASKPGNKLATAWLSKLLQRRPRKLAAVALANKMARIAWAMMTTGEAYRQQPVAA